MDVFECALNYFGTKAYVREDRVSTVVKRIIKRNRPDILLKFIGYARLHIDDELIISVCSSCNAEVIACLIDKCNKLEASGGLRSWSDLIYKNYSIRDLKRRKRSE